MSAEITRGEAITSKDFHLNVLRISDKESVGMDFSSLEIGFSQDDNYHNISKNINLPLTGDNATIIRWSSDDPWIITNTGIVSRPTYTEGDKRVTVTAIVSRGNESNTKLFPLTVIRKAPTDTESVRQAVQDIELMFENDIPTDSVVNDLSLPRQMEHNVSVSWTSSNPSVIANDGKVEQPSYTQGSKAIDLTANFMRGSEHFRKEFTVIVPHLPQTDEEAVIAAKDALEIRFSEGNNHENVTQNITLPLHGTEGTTISWMSSDISVISRSGMVVRSVYEDKPVVVSASIQKGNTRAVKEFNLRVSRFSNEESVQLDKEALDIGYVSGDTFSSVQDSLVLASEGQKGTSITWESSDKDIITNNGLVKRPTYSVGHKYVSLTATITRGTTKETKSFYLRVVKLPPIDSEMAEEAVTKLSVRDFKFAVGDSIKGITGNITLPTTGVHDTLISWESSDSKILRILGSSGLVTQPSYYDGDTEIILTAKATKNSESAIKEITICVKKSMLKIGDKGPAGGTIFYVDFLDKYDWTYLEAAPAWAEVNAPWGGSGTAVGKTSSEVGTGKANTERIVNVFGKFEPHQGKDDYAAKYCYELIVGGYSDWLFTIE